MKTHPQRPWLHTLRQPSRPHLGPPATSQWLEEITRTMRIIVEVEVGKGAFSEKGLKADSTSLLDTLCRSPQPRLTELGVMQICNPLATTPWV